MRKRKFLGGLAATVLTLPGLAAERNATAAAAGKATSSPAATPAAAASNGEPFVVAINEGVTYLDVNGSADERFAALAADLQKIVRRPVQFKLVRRYPELVEGLEQTRYQLAYVHPAHHAIHALRGGHYRLLALTKGFTEYRVSFMVAHDSPLKSLADLKSRKVGAPDADSITSVIARATLREDLGMLPQMLYVRYQDAVPFMVENNLSACGVSASKAVVNAWTAKGGRVLHTSRPIPIKELLVASSLPDAQQQELKDYFLGLDRDGDGQRRLQALRVPGFVPGDPAALLRTGDWLGA